jgi:hypothetical protein
MPSGYASYGSALRAAAAVPMSNYDVETVLAFVADLFRKEFSDVERDFQVIVPRKRVRAV